MRGFLVLAVVLAGCEKQSDLYGGGDGFTLSLDGGPEFRFEPAKKKDLKDVADSRPTRGPVGYVSVAAGWTAYGVDDDGALSYLEELGVDCPFEPNFVSAYVNEGYAGFQIGVLDGEEPLLFLFDGAPTGGSGDAFGGEFDAEAAWAGPFDRCDGDATGLPTTFSMTYSFEEKVHVVNRCFGCDLIDL